MKLLNQEQLVEEASRILDDMTIVKQHIMNETPPIVSSLKRVAS